MPGSPTTPGRAGARDDAPARVAFRHFDHVGTRDYHAFAAQWLAYALPYRRFADTLAGADARLGADVDRYSFIVVDLHHLLLAGLPAHWRPALIWINQAPASAAGSNRAFSIRARMLRRSASLMLSSRPIMASSAIATRRAPSSAVSRAVR